IYNGNVWFPTIFVTFFLALFHNYIVSKRNMSANYVLIFLESMIKVYLERGDPYNNRQLKSQSARIVVCGFLIAALILSNAYKSTNVYNIVLPRDPLTYDTFDELMTDKFTVYTRVQDLRIDFDDLNITSPAELIATSHSVFGPTYVDPVLEYHK